MRLRWICIGVWLVAAFLRFYKLGQFNELVFDEVYNARFADNYLTGTHFFHSHPPVGKYFTALGIWLSSIQPFGKTIVNSLAGSELAAWQYRLGNAAVGSAIAPILSLFTWQVTGKKGAAGLAGLFVAIDGLFIVESRYALNNVYMIAFGLLGQWFWLRGLVKNSLGKGNLVGAILSFGCCVASKWSGLGFILGAFVWVWVQGVQPWRKLLAVNEVTVGAIACVYGGLWLPHLWLNPQLDFWEVHQKILVFHRSIGDGQQVHPYCSPWYSWILMARPVAYYYQASEGNHAQHIYDVHALGNPVLWWGSSLTIALFLGLRLVTKRFVPNFQPTLNYILINYAANLLPWMFVSRCTFLYHYMAAYSFGLMAIAWSLDQWQSLRTPALKRFLFKGLPLSTGFFQVGFWLFLIAVGLAFWFWLPVYWGLPLSDVEFRRRMWFASWI